MITIHHHPKGRGAIVDVHLGGDSWHGNYRFVTHGLTPEEIAAKHDAIVEHHRLKSERHAGFNRMDRNIEGFHVHGLAIVEQGTDVRLCLRVTTPAGTVLNLDRLAPTVADLPSDADIRRIVEIAASAWRERARESGVHVETVKTALGVTIIEGRA